MKNNFNIVGYSGHSFVILDSALKSDMICKGYYDLSEKNFNPFKIRYLGSERHITGKERLIITIGENKTRRNIYESLSKKNLITFLNIVDPTSSLSKFAALKPDRSIFVGANSVVNSLAKIGVGAIINTGAIAEHEVQIGDFSHVGPNATVCGGALIGAGVFIGANAVIKQGIRVGDNSIIGAGAVVVKDVQENSIYVGNPAIKIN